jgi:predicted NAD/FAD-binding protein
MKVAVIGSGISGLAAAHRLRRHAQVALFEAGSYFGGHTHTVDVTLPDRPGPARHARRGHGFSGAQRAHLPRFDWLAGRTGRAHGGVGHVVLGAGAGAGALGAGALEWSGSSLAPCLPSGATWLRPRFLAMLGDLLRFNRLCTALAERGEDRTARWPSRWASFLTSTALALRFATGTFCPCWAASGAAPRTRCCSFPGGHHGALLPQPRPDPNQQPAPVVDGGRAARATTWMPSCKGIGRQAAEHPVRRIQRNAAGVRIQHRAPGASILTPWCWPCTATRPCACWPSPALERNRCWAPSATSPTAPCCTPTPACCPSAVPPGPRGTTSARPASRQESARVCLHYLINRLQPLPFAQPVMVSLNPVRDIAQEQVLGEFDYAHPVFDLAAIRAQALCRSCRARSTPGSAAPGWVTAFMKTASSRAGARPMRCWRKCRSPAGGRMTPAAAPTCAAHRLWPCAAHASAPAPARLCLPTFFLMLPMRTPARSRRRRGCWPCNRPGCLSFFDDATTATAADPSQGGALAWLEALLHAEGIDRRHGEIWLHCYPRVLGYTFKPVSFWYCHRATARLRAIVVEVNNTFGERHCYLLDQPRYGPGAAARKVFHVSPFCAVEGDYRFRVHAAAGPKAWAQRGCVSITTTPKARCCSPAHGGRLEPLDRRQLPPRAVALPP